MLGYHRFELRFSAFLQLLISLAGFVSLRRMSRRMPFLVPIILSVHMSVGVRYKPVGLNVPVTRYGISYFRFLLCHTNTFFNVRTFLYGEHLDPYIRGFRQSVGRHSHHRHFIDPRRVIYTQHLCRAFVPIFLLIYGKLPPTSPSFRQLAPPVGVSGRAFQGVTLSFHPLNYQFSKVFEAPFNPLFSNFVPNLFS